MSPGDGYARLPLDVTVETCIISWSYLNVKLLIGV